MCEASVFGFPIRKVISELGSRPKAILAEMDFARSRKAR
jgi:hypothetical protein